MEKMQKELEMEYDVVKCCRSHKKYCQNLSNKLIHNQISSLNRMIKINFLKRNPMSKYRK